MKNKTPQEITTTTPSERWNKRHEIKKKATPQPYIIMLRRYKGASMKCVRAVAVYTNDITVYDDVREHIMVLKDLSEVLYLHNDDVAWEQKLFARLQNFTDTVVKTRLWKDF